MPGYVKESLQPGETVEYQGRVSRIAVFLRPLIMLLIAIVGLGVIGSKQHNNTNAGLSILSLFIVLDLIGGIIGLVGRFIFYKGAEYAVTDRRVIGKYGIIRRRAVDVLMRELSGVTISQSVPGRLFGFGTVWVLAGGASRCLIYVKQPLNFQKAIYARLDESRLLKGTAAYTLDVRMTPTEPPPPVGASSPPIVSPPRPPMTTQAQWAPDPYEQSALRYWDGENWTGHVSSGPPAPDPSVAGT